MTPDRLQKRVHAMQSGFSVGAALAFALAVPTLLQLSGDVRGSVRTALALIILLGSVLSGMATWLRFKRYRFLLQSLALDKREGKGATLAVDAIASFANEPASLTRWWLLLHALALTLMLSPLSPDALDSTTASAVVLLTGLMLATTCLPMHVLIRRDFLDVLELAPPALMHEMMLKFDKTPHARGRINRRIVVAVATPVLFVALGSALIVNAHLRHDDQTIREETARILARAALEVEPGGLEGLDRALDQATDLGFYAQIAAPDSRHGVILEGRGIVELTTPLQNGNARVRFNHSTISVLSAAPLLVSLLATVAAAIFGFLLGNVLSMDLYFATRGVRLLGATPAALNQHTGVLRPPRLRLVSELAAAIDRLTGRFAVFAQAQEDAIEARSTAVRARGLFFASVSHDLKAPLNSILGFTHLVGQQPLTQGQRESLDAIHTRAQELLALIETILDAARVEEGQLSLVTDEVPFRELFDKSVEKARQLSASFSAQIFEELDEDIPPVLVDRTRVVRAIATLIAYSVRSNEGGKMWIRAERETETTLRLDIDVPRPAHSPTQLEWMLSPTHEQRQREHRGLALGLRLARSVVQLHDGSVRVVDRGKKGAMFCVKLKTVEAPIPSASAPFHSMPPPPSSVPPPSNRMTHDATAHIPPPPALPTAAGGQWGSRQSGSRPADPIPSGIPGSWRPPNEREPTLPPPAAPSEVPPPFPSSRPPYRQAALPVAPHRPLAPSETPLPPASRPFSQPPPPPESKRGADLLPPRPSLPKPTVSKPMTAPGRLAPSTSGGLPATDNPPEEPTRLSNPPPKPNSAAALLSTAPERPPRERLFVLGEEAGPDSTEPASNRLGALLGGDTAGRAYSSGPDSDEELASFDPDSAPNNAPEAPDSDEP